MVIDENLGVFFVHRIHGHNIATDDRFCAFDSREQEIIVHFHQSFVFINSLIEILLG